MKKIIQLIPSGIKESIPVGIKRKLKRRMDIPDPLDILDNLRYPLYLPQGESKESVIEYLSFFSFEDQDEGEMLNYLHEDFERFLYTLQLIPHRETGKLLEIGANPYFTSLLLKKFRNYDLTFTNYYEGKDYKNAVEKKISKEGEIIEFDYDMVNVEKDKFPYDDNSFDVVLFCEVLEHLVFDPMFSLLEIRRVLKENGHLILTTPNVARLMNVARVISGENIYDPYSGYGMYGRHNREYTVEECKRLLTHVGFEVEEVFTSDVHENRAKHFLNLENYFELLINRKKELGQYIFLKLKNLKKGSAEKPPWLFRSFK